MRKVVAICRSKTWLYLFEPHECHLACEYCQPMLDAHANSRKSHASSARSTYSKSKCQKFWEESNAHKTESIALKHKQVCEYLNILKGISFEEEYVCKPEDGSSAKIIENLVISTQDDEEQKEDNTDINNS